ncbi:DUF1033 family protein [Streptococcus dentiloxodontae]
MYQVVEMKGDIEPWWFFDGWKEDIISFKEFDKYYDALKYYRKQWFRLEKVLPSYNSKSSVMTAFWDKKDRHWCEACDDYLQTYQSIALLDNWQEISEEQFRPGYEKRNDIPQQTVCNIRR